MKTVMIIPAKGFSRRIPEKNIHPFCGKPLVYWPILQGMTSKLVDEVVVSTDSKKIAKIATDLGAEVFMRGYKDTDDTSAGVALAEVMDAFVEQGRLKPDDIIVGHFTPCCICKPDDVDRLVGTLIYLNREKGGRRCEYINMYSEERTIFVGVRIGPNQYRPLVHCINHPASNNYEGAILRDWDSTPGTILLNKALLNARYVKHYYNSPPNMPQFYMAIEDWQVHDMDTPDEMEFGEVVMEHYILKGRGPAVYYEYAGIKEPK